MFNLRAWMLALVCLSGCATAQKSTMLAELTLATGTSIGYRTIDGIDKVKTDQIRAEIGTDKAKANADYAAYKPKIEMARAALNAADDVVQDAERVRQAASAGKGAWTDYTNWLPALTEAWVRVQQAIADVKELVK